VLHELGVLAPASDGGQTSPRAAAAGRAPSAPSTPAIPAPSASPTPDGVQVARVSSLGEYRAYRGALSRDMEERARLEASLVPREEAPFVVPGHCAGCRTDVDFQVGFAYSPPGSNGCRVPNWREHLTCPCGLNCRTRAAVDVMTGVLQVRDDDAIYVMEQTTPLFRWLAARHPGVVGSEYLGDRVGLGRSWRSLRNEDATRLTFADSTYDVILSFDVFEHMPDYRRAFEECWRCLKSGGRLLLTVPFVASRETTLVRARVGPSGIVEHLLPPEYHGDPVNPDGGILCFRHFGWDMLEELRQAGFETAEALLVWSLRFGYLGGEQLLFLARK
jgi:SAM-dependent methyltransferase